MEEGINIISPGSIGDQESSVTLDIKIERHERTALLDTGARPSVIDIVTLEQLGLVEKLVRSPDQVFGLCKSPVDVKGYVDVEIQIANGASVVVTLLEVLIMCIEKLNTS